MHRRSFGWLIAMRTNPLVFVRTTVVYPVPPVCSVSWTPEDWKRMSRVVTEPLTIDYLGVAWVATGERNSQGQLLYRKG